MRTTTKWRLFEALASGGPLLELGLATVQMVEREDGSGHCWNVKGYDSGGVTKTVFCRTEDSRQF